MKYYVVDVFTNNLFGGNPAGVCVLDKWLDDTMLQNIASENNLSETAFLIKQNGYYDLRWFTPTMEVDLCGHATIASAFILFKFYETNLTELSFKTMSGLMKVSQREETLFLDFPTRKAVQAPRYKAFDKAFDCENMEVLKAVDFLVVFKNEEQVINIAPDFSILKTIKVEANIDNDSFGVIITARGNSCDFVSRFFAPNAGVDEDPVTGRAHCTLIPYWAEKLEKPRMRARQLSKRSGDIDCEYCGERVLIGAKAVLYLVGDLSV